MRLVTVSIGSLRLKKKAIQKKKDEKLKKQMFTEISRRCNFWFDCKCHSPQHCRQENLVSSSYQVCFFKTPHNPPPPPHCPPFLSSLNLSFSCSMDFEVPITASGLQVLWKKNDFLDFLKKKLSLRFAFWELLSKSSIMNQSNGWDTYAKPETTASESVKSN